MSCVGKHERAYFGLVPQVKACLGADEYKEFSASVKLYQTKRDYDSVLVVLLRIFKDKENQHLLKREYPADCWHGNSVCKRTTTYGL